MIKRKTFFSIIVTLALVSAMSFAGTLAMGFTGKKAYADPVPAPEPTVAQKLLMSEGASVRETDPSGIRFTTYVNAEYYETLAASGKTFRFGTIYAPATAYSGTIEEFTHDSAVTGGIGDVIAGVYNIGETEVNETTYKVYNTVQLFSENARNNGYYGVKMFAKSYVYVDETDDGEDNGEYFYTEGVVRSIAQVAASALANGVESEYLEGIMDYAVADNGSVSLNGVDYHKAGTNSYSGATRENADYYYLIENGTADVTFEPVLLHSGAYMTAASDYAVTYASSDETVFTVSESGEITAIANGTATLSATVGTVNAPETTVKVITPAVSQTATGEQLTFDLSGVTYYGDSHILVLDAAYMAAKIAEGYNSVQFTVNSQGSGQRSVRMFINGVEDKIASGVDNTSIASGVYELTASAYNLLVRQSTAETLDMTVVVTFEKPFKAYKSSNGIWTTVGEENNTLTLSDSVEYASTVTDVFDITITSGGYTFIILNSDYVNQKIAEGFVRVAFYVGPDSGYKHVELSGTDITTAVQSTGNGSVAFDPVSLVADSQFRIRIILSATTDSVVLVQFFKDVDVVSYEKTTRTENAVTSSTAYNTDGELITYTFADVINHKYNYFEFTEKYINEKMAQGYKYVTFSMPDVGYKSATLYCNGTSAHAPGASNGVITFNMQTLSAGDDFRIVLYHAVNGSNPANIRITAQFTKDVKVLLRSDNTDIAFTQAVSTTNTENDTITYTLPDLAKSTDYRIYFNAQFINAKIAEGYDKFTVTVSGAWGYKDCYLDGATRQVSNGSVVYEDVALTANGGHNVQINQGFADTTTITVKVVFGKSA